MVFEKNKKRVIKVVGALCTSALIGAYSASAAFQTYSFPDSFVNDNNEFTGDIVIGQNAPLDRTIAQSLIDSLEETEGENRVRITYRDPEGTIGGDSIDIATKDDLNYGETLANVSESGGFDSSDSDVFQDETWDNDISDEDYEQTLELMNGEFNYALWDNIDDLDEITDGIYYDNNQIFAEYRIDLDNAIDLTDTDDLNEDMVGSELTIMGNEFVVGSISRDGSDLEQLELIGGRDRVSLNEGESTTVTIDGTEYDIEVRIVSNDKVALTINGESRTIDLYDSDEVGGVSIAVTDAVESSRESVMGFAEIVIGGQKITLEDDGGTVQINDEDIDDVFEDYMVTSDFSDGGNGVDEITITYRVDEEVLLQEGDSLEDVLFQAFAIRYDGTNEPEYTSLTVENDGDDMVSLDGTLIEGDDFNQDFIYTNTTTGTNGVTYPIADSDEDRRLFFNNANLSLYMPPGVTMVSGNEIELNFSESDIQGNGFLLTVDNDEQYWYEISSVDTSDMEVDLEEVFNGDNIDAVPPSDFEDEVEVNINTVPNDTNGTLQLDLDTFGDPVIGFENEIMMDIGNAQGTGASGYLTFFYDGDINGDNPTDEDERYNVSFGWDANDEKITLNLDTNDEDFVNRGMAEVSDANDDTLELVTSYGTIVRYDNDEGDILEIMAPDEQVRGEASLVFEEGVNGDGDSESTIFVNSDEEEETLQELRDQGYEIVCVEEISGDIDYDIQILTADQVTDMNNKIIIGGPAVNRMAAQILGVNYPTYGPQLDDINQNEAVIRYYDDSNSLLIYGYEAGDTQDAVDALVERDINQRETYIE